MANPSAAAVFIAGEVGCVVQAVLDAPVISWKAGHGVGTGLAGAERGRSVDGLAACLSGFSNMAGPFDPERLLAPFQLARPVPFQVGEVEDGAASRFEAAAPLVEL
ncbi:MAG: hypothetical protein OXC26_12750, partial [Albidovulum sp.]|nr:hypothetical protein [Albidovulum sp.]